jgi:hypothetical protein
MNKKQRVLTVIALITFVVIGACRYLRFDQLGNLKWVVNTYYATIPDARPMWFMLGVIYVGLFFLLADKKEKRP